MVYAEQRRNMAKDEIANVVIFRGSPVCLGDFASVSRGFFKFHTKRALGRIG